MTSRTGAAQAPVVGDAQLVADVRGAIAVFTRARYGRHDDPTASRSNDAELISALDTGLTALTRLRWLTTAPMRAISQARATLAEWITWTR